ncbi:MAG: molybdenum ABC transporter ATP-binding protein [Propionivibrio sp.]
MHGIEACFRIDWPGFTLDVDLTLPARGVTALFGHSGSGKTTLLRCIAGLERASRGRLAVDGEIWQDDARWLPTHRRPLGYAFQEASLFPHLSVLDNLRYGMKRSPKADTRRVSLDQAIELLGIAPLLERKPDRLSGGERSRVGIARALAVSPRLLLMDEPLAALDLKRKQEILPYLEKLHDELDIPVLYVSHSPDEVARLADHLVALDNGRCVANGPLVETLSRLDLPFRLGEDAGVVIDAVVSERDPRWHLAAVTLPGGRLWFRDGGHPVGHRARVRILARDVSIARERCEATSIQNTQPATVVAIADDTHPALALVRLDMGGTIVIARLTHRAAAALELKPGLAVWAQIKAVALVG